jgi:hypothetical protein
MMVLFLVRPSCSSPSASFQSPPLPSLPSRSCPPLRLAGWSRCSHPSQNRQERLCKVPPPPPPPPPCNPRPDSPPWTTKRAWAPFYPLTCTTTAGGNKYALLPSCTAAAAAGYCADYILTVHTEHAVYIVTGSSGSVRCLPLARRLRPVLRTRGLGRTGPRPPFDLTTANHLFSANSSSLSRFCSPPLLP